MAQLQQVDPSSWYTVFYGGGTAIIETFPLSQRAEKWSDIMAVAQKRGGKAYSMVVNEQEKMVTVTLYVLPLTKHSMVILD